MLAPAVRALFAEGEGNLVGHVHRNDDTSFRCAAAEK
jgi:hypothetical protein